jgi:competence protein ComEA
MNRLKNLWSNIFGISASEYSGFRLLVFTALVCWLGLALANHLTKSPYNNYKEDAKLLDSLLLVMDYNESKADLSIKSVEVELEVFDPNTVSQDKLLQFGFPNWLAKRLINYRSSGARFSEPEDLLKLYDFPDSLYYQIVDYISIKKVISLKTKKVVHKKPSSGTSDKRDHIVLVMFDLNTGDTAVFQTVKGIGSKLSNRIVNYRASLGGFVDKDQLYQVYGLDSLVIEKLQKTSLITLEFTPDKIDINSDNKEQLASHPYINWNQAKLIIAYRNQHGSFDSEQDLLKVYSLNENWVKKIAPYLTF